MLVICVLLYTHTQHHAAPSTHACNCSSLQPELRVENLYCKSSTLALPATLAGATFACRIILIVYETFGSHVSTRSNLCQYQSLNNACDCHSCYFSQSSSTDPNGIIDTEKRENLTVTDRTREGWFGFLRSGLSLARGIFLSK